MPKQEKEAEAKTCSCTQAAVDLLRDVSPVKDGMLREVKCKSCGKTFLTNFDTDYCFDCRRKNLRKVKSMAQSCGAWYPIIFPEKCDGCASLEKPRCVEFCPNGVFTILNDKAVVAHPHKCVNGCTACEPVCHKKAISFPRRLTAFAPVKPEDKGLLRKAVCVKCGKTYWTNRETDICMDCESKK